MMGDIVHLPDGECDLSVHVRAAVPIERVDIFNGRDLVQTVRPYGEADLGSRIRLVWEGAEYRGRFRQVIWDGHAEIAGNEIAAARAINFFNPDRPLTIEGSTRASWKALTTGNIGGVDLWLKDGAAGRLSIRTPLVEADMDIAEIGYDDTVFDRSGVLPRYLKVFRLPESMVARTLDLTYRVPLRDEGDNPIFIRLTQEDGTIAWTSPIYIFR